MFDKMKDRIYEICEDEVDQRIDANQLMMAKDWLEEVVHQIYNIGSISMMEEALEELCALLNVDMPTGEPKLEKKKNILQDLGVLLIKQIKEGE